MPTISAFYGLIIQMFFKDHAPAHFHVKYAEYKAIIDIKNLKLIEGKLPRRALGLALDWAELHQAELLADWQLCQDMQNPKPIAPWSDIMEWDVTEVKVVGDFTLAVRFQDGLEGGVRFLPSFFRGVFLHLANVPEFKKVHIVDGVVTWPGELDLAPDAMYAEIKRSGEWLLN